MGNLAGRNLVLFAGGALACAGAVIAKVRRDREALTRRAQDKRLILDNVRDVIFRTDADARWVMLNRAWADLTGFAVEHTVGGSVYDHIAEPDLPAFRTLARALYLGEQQDGTVRLSLHRRSGNNVLVEVRIRRLADATGGFAGTIGNIRDVTLEHAQAQAIQASEARFRHLAESVPIGIFRADAAGNVTYLNQNLARSVGRTVEELSGGGWRDAVIRSTGADDPAARRQYLPDTIYRRELRFRDKGDRPLWVEVYSSGEFDADSTLTGLFGAVVDITEQKLALDKLEESERTFHTLANLAPAGIFRTDSDGMCSYVNDAWRRLTGLCDGQWEGTGWATALHPADADRVFRAWTEAVAKRGPFREEWRWLRSDGSIVWVDTVGRPQIDENGIVTGFVGVNVDITARRHADAALAEREATLTLLTDNVTDTVLRLGVDGTCWYASPSCAETFGLAPEGMVGENLLSLVDGDDRARIAATLSALMAAPGQRTLVSFMVDRTRGGGTPRWLEANCMALVDEAGVRDPEIIASMRDVTATKALEAELRTARERAEQAVQAQSRFLANMSHEIRTPMNGVLGFTDLLLTGELSATQRTHVKLIADSGRAMMRLLNDILDISKIEAGQMRIARESFDLAQQLRGMIGLMEPIAAEKGIALTLRIDPALPQWIDGDSLRLRQVILNLVGNAVKFTERGRVVVDVRADGDRIAFEVIDTGAGIAPDQLEAIFSQFSQADGTIARRFGGTGLGLPISRQLVALMGGELSVDSSPGEGSVFRFDLPLGVGAPADAYEDADADPVRDAVIDTAGFRRDMRILVAEDNDINQQLLLGIAAQLGITFDIAEDGAIAIDRVAAASAAGRPYDLVLMDMQMPRVDGLTATRMLRNRGFTADILPVVALTANAFPEDVEACLAAGMQAHLVKPLRINMLVATLVRFDRHANDDMPVGPPPVAEPPSTGAQPARGPVSSRLRQKYLDRKQELIDMLRAVEDGAATNWPSIESQLHQLAGVAGMFGEAAVGEAARTLEHALRSAQREEQRRALVDEALATTLSVAA